MKHLSINGIVQGVGYRMNFAAQARELTLSGWVRNRPDGSVEAMVCGDENVIEKLVAWAWHGPSGAQVDCISVTDAEDAAVTNGIFTILATA